jgi:hypothetical protein
MTETLLLLLLGIDIEIDLHKAHNQLLTALVAD